MGEDTSKNRNCFKLLGELMGALPADAPSPAGEFRIRDVLGHIPAACDMGDTTIRHLPRLLQSDAGVVDLHEEMAQLGQRLYGIGLPLEGALLVVLGIHNMCLTRLCRSGLPPAQVTTCSQAVQQLFYDITTRIRAVYRICAERPQERTAARMNPTNPLTAREREIVLLLMQGYRTREIAASLRISTKTVEAHRSHAMTKLKVRNVAQLVYSAMQLGLQPARFDAEHPTVVK